MSTYCKVLKFGKHRGKTIEEVHFIDYGWLYWAMQQPNLVWIKKYVQMLPNIYPRKIKVYCGENHHAGCKTKIATRVSLPIDYMNKIVAHPGCAYYWYSDCSIYSAGDEGKLVALNLQFENALKLRRKSNLQGFHQILRHAYGIRRLTPKKAYQVFWE